MAVAQSAGFVGSLLGAATAPIRMGANMAFRGGLPGRVAVGAGVGAGASFIGGDYNTPTGTISGMMQGALAGGFAGALVSAPSLAFRANRAIGKNVKGFANLKRLAMDQPPLRGPASMYGPATAMAAGAGGTAYLGARAAMKAGMFAFEHPLATAGIAGGAYGITQLPIGQEMKSPTLTGGEVDINYDQQAAAAELLRTGGVSPMGTLGTAPEMMGRMNRTMMHSTYGLTQGLHRGRHG